MICFLFSQLSPLNIAFFFFFFSLFLQGRNRACWILWRVRTEETKEAVDPLLLMGKWFTFRPASWYGEHVGIILLCRSPALWGRYDQTPLETLVKACTDEPSHPMAAWVFYTLMGYFLLMWVADSRTCCVLMFGWNNLFRMALESQVVCVSVQPIKPYCMKPQMAEASLNPLNENPICGAFKPLQERNNIWLFTCQETLDWTSQCRISKTCSRSSITAANASIFMPWPSVLSDYWFFFFFFFAALRDQNHCMSGKVVMQLHMIQTKYGIIKTHLLPAPGQYFNHLKAPLIRLVF